MTQSAESKRRSVPSKVRGMADLTYYAAKIAECLRMLEGSSDQLSRDVYQAMADEFAQKYAVLARAGGTDAPAVLPSPLLHRIAPRLGQSAPPGSVGTGAARQRRRRASDRGRASADGEASAVGSSTVLIPIV